ncbi:TAXI family TRAP transporter solute-binding subunit [Yoonia sp. R2331]|uniref:TAXI family TRAP transporter solute-binding subunit n=1 Tax=Yoonia sp. R2331 TaxID=3237238 RepID=UPI0034E4DEFD
MNTIRTMIAASALVLGATAGVQADELKAESAGQTGLTSIVLQVMGRDLAGTDTSITLNTGQTLSRSAIKLAAEQIDVAIVPPRAFNAMTRGAGPYKEMGDDAKELSGNLRSLFAFTGGALHSIVRADSGIEQWSDVAGKRVYIGPPGGNANAQLSSFVNLMSGLEADADYETVKMGWGAAVQSFQDGQFDVLNFSTAVGSAAIVQLLLQGDFRFLQAPEGMAESADYADFLSVGSVPGGIPANSYEGVENGDVDVLSYNYTMLVGVNQNMSDDEAYLLTATFWDNLEKNSDEIALLKSIAKSPFAGNNMPLHPGAVRYYTENGIEVPAELLAP